MFLCNLKLFHLLLYPVGLWGWEVLSCCWCWQECACIFSELPSTLLTPKTSRYPHEGSWKAPMVAVKVVSSVTWSADRVVVHQVPQAGSPFFSGIQRFGGHTTRNIWKRKAPLYGEIVWVFFAPFVSIASRKSIFDFLDVTHISEKVTNSNQPSVMSQWALIHLPSGWQHIHPFHLTFIFCLPVASVIWKSVLHARNSAPCDITRSAGPSPQMGTTPTKQLSGQISLHSFCMLHLQKL